MVRRQTLFVCQSKEFAALLTGGCVCLPSFWFRYVQPAGGINVASLYNAVFVRECVCRCLCADKGVSESTKSSVYTGCLHGPLSFLLVGSVFVCACQGLFRIAAGASKLKKLKAALDCSTSQLEEFYSDPHAVAGTSPKLTQSRCLCCHQCHFQFDQTPKPKSGCRGRNVCSCVFQER